MISVHEEERADKLAALAKKKLHKYQSKKVNQTDGLEQDNIRLKERLFNSENQIELMQHEIQSLKQRNKELKSLLTRDDAELRFLDHQASEAYEREERAIYNDFRHKIIDLKERYKGDSAELCSGCMGELIEI
ncbi:unnamed protein product [Mucor circinelloides]|uniref:Uncharacterized protein n=1 Tax=Mucor circinelloides f. circinelloides (strain 1006PhL) TaxID=1220926 RepID=S2J1R3_MUCC1|nr:hypothetical protein HMPREF1544_11174 [Mucor circinelloides 1006PhL]